MSFKPMPVATFLSGKRRKTEFLCSFGVLPLDQGQGQEAAVLRCAVCFHGNAEDSYCSESSVLC